MRFFSSITTVLGASVAYLAAVANALQLETSLEEVGRGFSYEIRWSPADILVKIVLWNKGGGLVSVLTSK